MYCSANVTFRRRHSSQIVLFHFVTPPKLCSSIHHSSIHHDVQDANQQLIDLWKSAVSEYLGQGHGMRQGNARGIMVSLMGKETRSALLEGGKAEVLVRGR